MSKSLVQALLLVALSIASNSVTRAQGVASQSSAAQVLTNTDVVKMVDAKLTDDLIVSKIKASTCNCDTSIDAILKLKGAGVSDAVIQAMVESSAAATSGATATAAPSDPNDPLSLGDPEPLITVHVFKTSVDFPYDFKQLQIQTVVELKRRNVSAGNTDGTYTLEGEIVEWKAGNRATRMLVGFGTGRESAKIRFWLTDQKGTKVFERTDTIRQSIWGGAAVPSAGQLVQPFAVKIAERIADSRPVKQ
jgi:hypothetical protein